jgi:hypothetical protein
VNATCPQGHESDDADFCTVCGALIGASIAVPPDPAPAPDPPPPPEAVAPAEPCPNCQTMRFGDDQFCEVCRYDFLHPEPLTTAPVDTAPLDTAPLDDERPVWQAVVSADRDHYDRTSPDDIVFPSGLATRVLVLDQECVRIGRRSEARNTHPEIDLAGPPEDTGVSRVHAVLNRQGDGSYAIVDMGSANGTTVNDDSTPLVEGMTRPLQHGDRIHVGAWSTITILQDPPPD